MQRLCRSFWGNPVTELSQSTTSRAGSMGRTEFIALAAMLMALNALAIDIMLPVFSKSAPRWASRTRTIANSHIRLLLGFGIAQLLMADFGPFRASQANAFSVLRSTSFQRSPCVFVPSFSACCSCASFRALARRQHASSPSRSCVIFTAAGRWRKSCRDHDGLHGRSGHRTWHRPDRALLRQLAPHLRLHGRHCCHRNDVDVFPPAGNVASG